MSCWGWVLWSFWGVRFLVGRSNLMGHCWTNEQNILSPPFELMFNEDYYFKTTALIFRFGFFVWVFLFNLREKIMGTFSREPVGFMPFPSIQKSIVFTDAFCDLHVILVSEVCYPWYCNETGSWSLTDRDHCTVQQTFRDRWPEWDVTNLLYVCELGHSEALISCYYVLANFPT